MDGWIDSAETVQRQLADGEEEKCVMMVAVGLRRSVNEGFPPLPPC